MPRLRRHPSLPLLGGLTLAAALVLASCAPKPAPPPPGQVPSGRLSKIVQSGRLKIGTSGTQPPLSMRAKNGELIGLDVALGRVLARSMKLQPEFVAMPFGNLLGALESGDVDIVMSGVTITPARQERVEFAGPYYTSGKSILVRTSMLAHIGSAEELNAAAPRLVAVAGTTSEQFARESVPRSPLVTAPDLDGALAILLDGRADALVADAETCAYGALKHPDAGLIASKTRFTVEPMGIAVAQDNPRLAHLVDTYLNAIEEHGILDKAKTFWFTDSSWVKDVQ